MYIIDYYILFFIIGFTGIIYLISHLLTQQGHRRLYLLFISCSILIYSGIGISFKQIENKYLVNYIFFLTVLLLTINFIFIMSKSERYKYKIRYSNILDTSLEKYTNFYFTLSVIYILALLTHLFIPVYRVNHLWNPPSPSILDIFDRRELIRINKILYFANFINLSLRPFFFLYLYKLKVLRKHFSLFIWVFLWFYLDYLSIGYWGRHEIITHFIFLFLLFILDSERGYRFKTSHIMLILIIIVTIIPFLLGYESLREEKNLIETTFKDSFNNLFLKETDYPKYFSSIEYMTHFISPADYFRWLIALPIPSVIMPNKFTLGINSFFSSALLGIPKGHYRYTVILPSVLGESFLIYNMNIYWVHAIVIGIITGFTCTLSERAKSLRVFNLYYAVQLLTIGRGGSQGFIGEVINSSFAIIVWVMFLILQRGVSNRFNLYKL